MDAMILAAGLGTRLRPLTDHTPKPLVEVAGATVLEHIARRLIAAGADRIIVNVHHLPEQMEAFARERWSLDAELVLSFEREQLLGTGGGLLHAAPLFRRDAPFLLHVGDVVTDVDFGAMVAAHEAADEAAHDGAHGGTHRAAAGPAPGPLATLAVHERDTARALLFDDGGLLGRDNRREGWEKTVRPPRGPVRRRAFAGIHVVSPRIFDAFVETPPFDILDAYLRRVAEGDRVAPHDIGASRWLEVGTLERLEAARRVLEGGAG